MSKMKDKMEEILQGDGWKRATTVASEMGIATSTISSWVVSGKIDSQYTGKQSLWVNPNQVAQEIEKSNRIKSKRNGHSSHSPDSQLTLPIQVENLEEIIERVMRRVLESYGLAEKEG